VRDETDPLATAPAQTTPEPGTDPTRAGSVLGTPAFMPPEQAIGAIDRIDRRSDVFGLGAILCALLTGKPPFVGADGEALRQMAARAKLDDAFARLDSCGAEPGLVALAKRCLSAEQDDRPTDAGVLAEAVARLRREAEERARQAELDRARADVRAQEQTKRRRLLALGAGVLVAVLLAGMVGTTVGMLRAETKRKEAEDAKEREQKQREVAEKAKEEKERQREKAEKAKEEAEERREQAKRRYQLALDAFNDMVRGIQNKLETRPGTLELRKELLGKAREGLRKLIAEAERQGDPDSTLVWAHLRMGDVELLAGNTKAAQAEYESGHELAKRLALDDPKSALAQRDLSVSYNKLGDVTLRLGKTDDALGWYNKGLEIFQKLAHDDPSNTQVQRDLSVSYEKLGDVTLQLGKTDDALAWYNKGLEVRLKLATDDPSNTQARRDLSFSYNKLGDATLRLGKTDDALAFSKKGLEVRLKLATDDPRNTQAQRDLSLSYNKLGDVTLQLGKTDEALGWYRKGLEVNQKLATDDPRNAETQRDLSVSYIKLGNVTLRLGKTDDALAFYNKSLEVSHKLATDDPSNAEAQTDLFISYWKLGSAEKAHHHYAKAAEWFAEGRAVLLPLHQKKLLVGQFANAVADMDRQLALCKAAEKAITSLSFVLAQKPDLAPLLFDVRVRALLYHKKVGDAVKAADCWADWFVARRKTRLSDRYNAACALALCAGLSGEKNALASRAVALLSLLHEYGYFDDPKRLAHFEKDTDFAAVRDHPAFAKFAASLKKQ
jgi:tetratricopeptide (TPR) repeat protein